MLKDQHFINKISTGISTGFNHPKTNIGGISHCYECNLNNIEYDFDHDEIRCVSCGLVLRQGLKDYTPLECAMFPKTSQEIKKIRTTISLNNSIDKL